MKKTPGDILLHMCTINEDHMIYGSKDIRHDGQSFLSFWVIFAPFPSEQPERSKFWKNGKNPGDIIIVHLCCTTNDDHILTAQEMKILKNWKKMLGYMILLHQKWKSYDVWFLRNGVRHSFLLFWAILCPFTPLKIWKIKILKEKKKKHLRISSFYTCVPQVMIRWSMVPEISRATDRISCHVGPFFALLSQ